METTSVSERPPSGRRWLIGVIGIVVAAAFVIGILALTQRDEDATSVPTLPAVSTIADTTVPTSTMPSTTESTDPTDAAGTAAPTTIATTATTTTVVTVPPPSGATWTVESRYLDAPMTLERVVDTDGVAVYDGRTDDEPGVRCVVLVLGGQDGWRETCGTPGIEERFVAATGEAVLAVDIGAEAGEIRVSPQARDWRLRTNGCTTPIGELVASIGLDAQVATGAVCAGDAAFVQFGSVLLQDGGPDGGGVLLVEADAGWRVADAGTSVGCRTDAADRCAQFGVTDDLFEAVLPIPPPDSNIDDVLATGLANRTAQIRESIGPDDGVDAIVAAVEGQLVDPTGEAASETIVYPGPGGGRLDLVMVVAGQLDDSIGSVTMAVWVDTDAQGPDAVVRATSWSTCVRGVDGDLCV